MFLEISQNSQENTCARVSFWIKLRAWACNFIKKETLAQVSSYELCEISKNTSFTERLWTTASTVGRRCSIKKGVHRNFARFTGKHLGQRLFFNYFIKKESLTRVFSCEFCEISKNTFFYRTPLVVVSETPSWK